PVAMVASAGPRYFETMGTPLLEGREFTGEDKPDTEPVAVINEAFFHRMFGGLHSHAEVIGKRISFKSVSGPFMRIVGVAKDGKYFNIAEEPRPFIWTALAQDYSSSISLVVRTNREPETLIAAVRGEARALDPNLPLFDVKTMNEHMRLSL